MKALRFHRASAPTNLATMVTNLKRRTNLISGIDMKMTRDRLTEIERRLGWSASETWPVPESVILWASKASELIERIDSLEAETETPKDQNRPTVWGDCNFCGFLGPELRQKGQSLFFVACPHCHAQGPAAGNSEDAWNWWNATGKGIRFPLKA